MDILLRMPPRPAVHPSKKEAVFQLCNFLCCRSICSIADLADGKILLETIQTKYSQFSNDCPSTSSAEEIETNENKVYFLQNKEESSDVNSRNINETNFNPANEENDILLRFNCIKKFIDDHYGISSETIISYDECRKSSELELIKVATFILSQIIKHLIDINNEYLQTLFHFEVKYQIELEDIFKVFITEREKLTKNEIEKLLSKSAKKASPIVTPRRTSSRRTSSKEQISVSPIGFSTAPNEDVFTNSPLKTFFESPIFKTEDIMKKNKEIKDIQNILYAEDELQILKLSEMEKELEKKDKDYKQLEKQNRKLLKQKEEEIELVKNSFENLSCEYKKLLKENDWNRHYYPNRVMELTTQLAEVKKKLEEKEKQEEFRIENTKSFCHSYSTSSSSPNKIDDALRMEIAILKEKCKHMELKIFSLKKQLSNEILEEVKQRKLTGNLNQSYEEMWNEMCKKRIGVEENLARVIEEDNRNLISKLNEANLRIQNLTKEIEALKKKENRKNNQRNRQKGVSSVATVMEIKNVPELSDSSQIPETEKLRKSLNHSENFEHDNLSDESYYVSDNLDNSISCEQSIISAESEAMIPCPQISSEAILWKMHDIQKPETDSTCGINLSHRSVSSENSHLDVMTNLGMNNIKIANVEPDGLQSQEYALENLNFDLFLNELKKLTKNGSFQKVLQVFGNRQNEINGTNRFNRLDRQELLKMITECVRMAVSLNAESFTNLHDKCCSTDEKELCSVNQKEELDKLKNELSAASQKYEIELKECKMELEELRKSKKMIVQKCQDYDQIILQKNNAIEDMFRRYKEQKINVENEIKKCLEYKASFQRLLVKHKKACMTHDAVKIRTIEVVKELRRCQNLYKLSKEENNNLKQELQKLKEERDNLLKEQERKSNVPASYSRNIFSSRESYVGIPNHLSIKSELHSSTSQDADNESVLSSAFPKNISHYVSENEDDFFDYNSLDSIKKEYDSDRVGELKRRNSLYPIHLQSSYPLEADLETTYASLYVKDGENVKEEEHFTKKRKLADMQLEMPPDQVAKTPIIRKAKKKFVTPPSLRKLLQYKPRTNSYTLKPKPCKR